MCLAVLIDRGLNLFHSSAFILVQFSGCEKKVFQAIGFPIAFFIDFIALQGLITYILLEVLL